MSNILLKYLLAKDTKNIQATLMDYEQFDFQMSNELNNLHLIKDVSELYLDFNGLKQNGDKIEVTNDNLDEYIALQTRHKLITSREQNMKWIREGFYKMTELKLLQVNDYHILLTGQEKIDIESIVTNCFTFCKQKQISDGKFCTTHHLFLLRWRIFQNF